VPEQPIPDRWRFSLDTEEESFRELTWTEAVRMVRTTQAGHLDAQASGECVIFEFNTTHAAMLYMGRDGMILQPYFPHRPESAQEFTPSICSGCGVGIGSQDDYLSGYFRREDGLRLLAAVLRGPTLPRELPDPHPDRPLLPGFEEMSVGRELEWRALPSGSAQGHRAPLGVAFGEDGLFVSVWVGTLGSKEAVEAYTLEQYEDDREHDPISPFAADIGLRFYDHDFFEVNHASGLSDQGTGAFSVHSYGTSFAAKAWEVVKQIGIDSFDTVFLLYGYNHQRTPQAVRRPKRVNFVGTFPYLET
jgi:hypothetical protein